MIIGKVLMVITTLYVESFSVTTTYVPTMEDCKRIETELEQNRMLGVRCFELSTESVSLGK